MDYKTIEEIDSKLKALSCKSYDLEITFTDTEKIRIIKEPNKEDKKIGY